MKRKLTLLLLTLLPVVVVMAEPVDKDAARLKAEAFFTKQSPSSARRARVQQDIRLALTNESYHAACIDSINPNTNYLNIMVK